MSFRVHTFLVLFATALSGVLPSAASAWCRMTTSTKPQRNNECVTEGVPLSWSRRCSSYSIHEAGGLEVDVATLRDAMTRAFDPWLAAQCGDEGYPGFDIAQTEDLSLCDTAQFNDRGAPNVQTIAFVSDWAERDYEDGAYAITTVFHNTRTGEILDVDMEINERRGPYVVCPNTGCTDVRGVDLVNVLTHEAGHYLGFAHSDDREATMYSQASPGETKKRDLNADDIDALCTVYPPGTFDDACNYTPLGGYKLTCGLCEVSATGAMVCPRAKTGCKCAAAGAASDGSRSTYVLTVSALGLFAVRRRRRGRLTVRGEAR